jgi:UDP-3-O-[3-hydroxymyristoyl] glucosamine N-acyltransferase
VKTTVKELAALLGGHVFGGDPATVIEGFSGIAEASAGDLTFYGNAKYLAALRASRATAALVPLDFSEEIPALCIRVENPSMAFAKIVEAYSPKPVRFVPGIHPSAIIAPEVELGTDVSIQPHAVLESGVKIGARTVIGAGTYLGRDCQLGEDCHVHPNVTIRENVLIGNRVAIHSGTVIGSDGFGYEPVNGRHVKIPQVGIVQLDDDVEIGANVTIDRARFGRTRIGEGTKIDNLVQIGHNVSIGKHCIVIAQAGIAGSSRLGEHVILAGQVGIAGHLTIGDHSIVAAQSGVSKDIPAGETWFGYPAKPDKQSKRDLFYLYKLEKLFARVKKLEQLLDSKEKSSDEPS